MARLILISCHADVSSHCFFVVDLCKDISAKVEEHIIKGLRSLHPDHQFIGEESMAEVRLLMHSGEHGDDHENEDDDDYEDEADHQLASSSEVS